MNTKKFVVALVFFLFSGLSAQSVSLTGTIKDTRTDKPIKDAIVRIENTQWSTKSNEEGSFQFKDIPVNKYYLVFIKSGYYSLVTPDVEIRSDEATVLNIQLCPGDENEFLFLEIGGIQVTADRELLSEEPETVHSISSGEIEHMQANSLADVLDMIPGNEKTSQLGLQRAQSITLRTFNNAAEDQSALFGTKVIVDDVPLTNNADLQTGVGVGYGSAVQSTAGSQYDLREVVAENLEKVEVMSGASSVEYGDHSQGVILVKTRTKNVPTRMKLKNNPDTREANMMGSFGFGKTDFVYNLNYGYSERDIRVTGDEYHRIAGSLKSANVFWKDRLALDQSLTYNRKIEEDNDPTDPYSIKAYNRDHHFTYSQQFDYEYSKVTQVYMRNFVDYKRRNSWKHKLENADIALITDRTTPGIQEAIISEPSYFSNVNTIGDEWAFGSKLKSETKWFWGKTLHRLLTGLEFQGEKNTGPGKTYDILRPPNGDQNHRPRSFSDIPGIYQLALFAEDRLTGNLIFPYTIDLGFRLDSYNPSGLNFGNLFNGKDLFEADQGTFFNPRIGLKLELAKRSQIRFTYSKSSKTPALSYIYPENFYLDVPDYYMKTSTAQDGSDSTYNVPLMRTEIYKRSSPNLKGYQTTIYEVGFDQQIGNFGLSLIGFYEKTNNTPASLYIPYTYSRYYWPDWPSQTNPIEVDRITTVDLDYEAYVNVRKNDVRGVEFSLRTHRIKKLNMRFRISGSYNLKKYNSKKFSIYQSTTRTFTNGDTLSTGWVVPEDMQIVPYYSPTKKWNQKTIINYSVDYIAKPLGIWLTLKAQQVLWDYDLNVEDPHYSSDGYFYNGENVNISPEMSTLMQLDRTYDELDTKVDKSKPNDNWLFSVVVSKSLYKGAEISLFVENIFNDRAYYINNQGNYSTRNPEIFWGIAFSSKLDNWFK